LVERPDITLYVRLTPTALPGHLHGVGSEVAMSPGRTHKVTSAYQRRRLRYAQKPTYRPSGRPESRIARCRRIAANTRVAADSNGVDKGAQLRCEIGGQAEPGRTDGPIALASSMDAAATPGGGRASTPS
jgi:hypothetical protein